MITDRTKADVTLAKTLRLKIQSGQSLTDTEKAQFERGFCTITMINRVNSKIKELETKLNSIYYKVISTLYTDEKEYSDIYTGLEYNNLFKNINKLRNAFYVYNTTPKTPSYLYGFQEANNIEKILVDIESMITDMENKYRECDTFYCGEENTN